MPSLTRNRRILYAAASSILALAAITFVPVRWASAAPSSTKSVFHIAAKTSNIKLLTERRLSGGDYAASWRLFGLTVSIAAPAGSLVTVEYTGHGYAAASVKPPALPRKAASLSALAATYHSRAKTVQEDATAVGFTTSAAAKLNAGVRPNATILNSSCASVSADKGHVTGRSCDIQTLAQVAGTGNWYISDEITGTGSSNDINNEISGFAGYVVYPSGNTIVKWAPNGPVYESNCTTYTTSVGWNGTGYSASSTVCPQSMTPYGLTNTKFGADWSGCALGNVGVNATDIDHNPPGVNDVATVWAAIWWSYCIFN